MNLRTRTRREGDVQKLESSADLETIHKGRPQNFRDFSPPPPIRFFVVLFVRKIGRFLDPPPLGADVLYEWSLTKWTALHKVKTKYTICRLMNDFYPLDSRGLEVCGHGGRPGAVVALFLRHHRWDGRDPHGRAAHL